MAILTLQKLIDRIESGSGKTRNQSELNKTVDYFDFEVVDEIDNDKFKFPFEYWTTIGNNTRWFYIRGGICVGWNFDRPRPYFWFYQTSKIEEHFEQDISLICDPSGETEKTYTTTEVSRMFNIAKDSASRKLRKLSVNPVGKTRDNENLWIADQIDGISK